MSGSYVDAAAATIAADRDAIAAGVSAAWAATQAGQMQTKQFIVAHGAEVVAGHPDTVGAAGSPPVSDIGAVDDGSIL